MSLHFWLIKAGEPLPTDPGNSRLLRTGMLAQALVEAGHKVDWWCDTFNHFHKKNRFDKSTCIESGPNLKLHAIFGPGYRKNVSWQRIRHHRKMAKEFQGLILNESPPDLILSSMPTIELCRVATNFGQYHDIPVVLDMRDLWPDIFSELVPPRFKYFMGIASYPFKKQLKHACQKAFAISGITPDFVQWGLDYAGRKACSFDRHFWHGYTHEDLAPEDRERVLKYWDEKGLNVGKDFIVCYFGSMAHAIQPVVNVAKEMEQDFPNIKFVFCGTGDQLEKYRKLNQSNKNILFPGFIGKKEITGLIDISSLGAACYPDRRDYKMSVPNKAIMYMSAGLPVLSSLSGNLMRLLDEYKCGLTYRSEQGFKDNLLSLYRDEKKYKIMSANAKALFEEKFLARKVYSAMVEHLEYLVSSHQYKMTDAVGKMENFELRENNEY